MLLLVTGFPFLRLNNIPWHVYSMCPFPVQLWTGSLFLCHCSYQYAAMNKGVQMPLQDPDFNSVSLKVPHHLRAGLLKPDSFLTFDGILFFLLSTFPPFCAPLQGVPGGLNPASQGRLTKEQILQGRSPSPDWFLHPCPRPHAPSQHCHPLRNLPWERGFRKPWGPCTWRQVTMQL